MRARLIKPAFFRDVKLLALPVLTRHVFAGLWCLADRAGRLADEPAQIKIDILPADDGDVDVMLRDLACAGFIRRYQAHGRAYIQIVNFLKHQSPNVREPASTIPEPDEYGTGTTPTVPEQSPDPLPDTNQGSGEEATTNVVAAAAPRRTPRPPRPDLRKPKEKERGWIEDHPLFAATVDLFEKPVGDQWALRAKCLRDLDELGATSADLRYRHARYPVVMGKDRDGTPMVRSLPALIKHWHLCAPPAVNGRARAPAEPPPRPKAETAELRRRILAGEDIA